MFGQCMDGFHADHERACPGRRKQWQHGFKKEGRKKVPTIIYTGEWLECDCECHGGAVVKSKKRKRKS